MGIFARRSGRRKLGPSMLLGFFLGIHIAAAVAFLTPGLVAPANARDLCAGTYPCFTSAACGKAGGAFKECSGEGKCPDGRGYCFAEMEPIRLAINIGSVHEVVDIGAYIEAIYTYSIGAAAVVAVVMIMVGGFQWLTAAGDAGRVSKAKTRINDALVGLMLTVFAWTILNTINPALIKLQMPRIPMVQKASFVQCDAFKMKVGCGHYFGIYEKEGSDPSGTIFDRYDVTEDSTNPDILTECKGMSCSMVGSDDGTNTCQQIVEGSESEEKTDSDKDKDKDKDKTETDPNARPGDGYECRACGSEGVECTERGPDSSCCGGYCAPTDDTIDSIAQRYGADSAVGAILDSFVGSAAGFRGNCSNGINGKKCGSGIECMGGKCVDVSDYFQALTSATNLLGGAYDYISSVFRGDIGGALSGARSIAWSPVSGLLNVWAGGICSNGSVGAPCNTDADCSGLTCLDDTGVHVCSSGAIGGYCSEDKHCASGRCDMGVGRCANQTGEVECTENTYCSNNYGADFSCLSIGGRKSCSNKATGTMCAENSQCESNHCYEGAIIEAGMQTGICTDGADGNGCDNNDDCESGYCHNFEGFGRVCIGPHTEAGMPCVPTGGSNQCGTGLTCHEDSQTCVPG